MQKIYKRAFDKIERTEAKRQELRNVLMNSEVTTIYNRQRRIRWFQVPVAAVMLVVVLLCIPAMRTLASEALKYVLGTFRFSDGTVVTLEQNEEGNETVFSVSMDGDRRGYTEVVNGRIYFIHDEIRKDVTEQCSETEYFQYEEVDEEGYRHLIFVGGTPKNAGWVELLFDSEGRYITNIMHVPEDLAWVELAMDVAGVPTGNPDLDEEFLD